MTTVPFSRLPGMPRIFNAFCEDFQAVSSLYAYDPAYVDAAVAGRLDHLRGRGVDRGKITSALLRHADRFGAPDAVRNSIATLNLPNAFVVIAGQQPGLFGGPLYTALKAIGVLKWAKALEARIAGARFVPVFWLSAEDHDWSEIDHVFVLDAESKVRQWPYRPPDAGDRTPAFVPRTGGGICAVIADGFASLMQNDFVGGAKALIEECYAPEATFATAFGRLLTRWFGKHGLVVFDSSDADVKELGAQLFEAELMNSATGAVIEATAKVKLAGFEAQVAELEGERNLFLIEGGVREKIVASGDGYTLKASGRIISKDEMKRLLAERPALFSPNVVLRPLYQDTLFPVALFLGGPHEIAYFAQVAAAYSHHGMAPPVVTARPSATLIDGRSAKILGELNLDAASAICNGADTLTSAAISRLLPGDLEAKYAEFAKTNLDSLSALKRDVIALDPTLASPMESLEAALLSHVKTVEKKVTQAYRQKNQQIVGKVARLRSLVCPNGTLQERTLSLLSFAARYGPDVVERIFERVQTNILAHQVIPIGEEV